MVVMSWPVADRWVFKEHVLTIFFIMKGFLKLQTVLLAAVILGFVFFFFSLELVI